MVLRVHEVSRGNRHHPEICPGCWEDLCLLIAKGVTLFAFPPESKFKASETVKLNVQDWGRSIILSHSWHGVLVWIFINPKKLYIDSNISCVPWDFTLPGQAIQLLASLSFLDSSSLFLTFPIGHFFFPSLHIPDCVLRVCFFIAALPPNLSRALADWHRVSQAGRLWFLRSIIVSRPSELQGFSGVPLPALGLLVSAMLISRPPNTWWLIPVPSDFCRFSSPLQLSLVSHTYYMFEHTNIGLEVFTSMMLLIGSQIFFLRLLWNRGLYNQGV